MPNEKENHNSLSEVIVSAVLDDAISESERLRLSKVLGELIQTATDICDDSCNQAIAGNMGVSKENLKEFIDRYSELSAEIKDRVYFVLLGVLNERINESNAMELKKRSDEFGKLDLKFD